MINPEKPDGFSTQIETWLPRFEGQVDYIIDIDAASIQLWAGGMYQNVNVAANDFDYDITGWDTGVRLNAAGFTVTGAYSQTQSVGADGLIGLSLSTSGLDEANVNATQWYTEAAYTTGQATFGLSYGEGSQDEHTSQVGAAPEITNTLLMGFGRYRLTDQLTLLLEIQSFTSDMQSNYSALIFGTKFTF